MRAEFFDGLNAGGNMRGNVGISDGDLFVSAANKGYKPAGNSTVASDLVDVNTIMAAILGIAAILRSHAAPVAHEPFAYGGIATIWSGAVGGLALPQSEKTFVFHVDQPATSEATGWSTTWRRPVSADPTSCFKTSISKISVSGSSSTARGPLPAPGTL